MNKTVTVSQYEILFVSSLVLVSQVCGKGFVGDLIQGVFICYLAIKCAFYGTPKVSK